MITSVMIYTGINKHTFCVFNMVIDIKISQTEV